MKKLNRFIRVILLIAVAFVMVGGDKNRVYASETTTNSEFLSDSGITYTYNIKNTSSSIVIYCIVENTGTMSIPISDLALVYKFEGIDSSNLNVILDLASETLEVSPYYVDILSSLSYEFGDCDGTNCCTITSDSEQMLVPNSTYTVTYRIVRSDWGSLDELSTVEVYLEYIGTEIETKLILTSPESFVVDGTSKEYSGYVTIADSGEVMEGVPITFHYCSDANGLPGTELETVPTEEGTYWVIAVSDSFMKDGKVYASATEYAQFTLTQEEEEEETETDTFSTFLRTLIEKIINFLFGN